MDLQSKTNEEAVSAGSLKLLAEPTRLLDDFTDDMDMGVGEGEKSWSIVERQAKAGSKAKAKAPISRSLATLSLVSKGGVAKEREKGSKAKVKAPASRSISSSSLVSKAEVSKVIQEELGKRDRDRHIVLSGLAFSKNNAESDESIVEAFFKDHKVSASFTTIKKVKSKAEPEITRIIVLDVGSVEIRDSIFRTVKPQLRNGLVFMNEEKSTQELRNEFKLREEARVLMKNLSEEARKTTRYCVRHGTIFNVGLGKFDSVPTLSV
jgi:hypothetical protein